MKPLILTLTRLNYVQVRVPGRRVPIHTFEPATLERMTLGDRLRVNWPRVTAWSETEPDGYHWRFTRRTAVDVDLWVGRRVQTFCEELPERVDARDWPIGTSRYVMFSKEPGMKEPIVIRTEILDANGTSKVLHELRDLSNEDVLNIEDTINTALNAAGRGALAAAPKK